ncbi:MAG: aminotransferase class I/II-fold pyridoxal phosphate-dependent enzyme [Actinobacteria bacterium]|nr:MAG: aminotransferase class I/II-fold pyridoxal phosphate-dependent enzyme [Actinomycetota bacterium]
MEPQSRQSVYGSSMRVSKKAASFTESVIRDMTRLAIKHDAINLAQGFPDFAAPQEIKDAAKRAIDADINQYAITWGAKPFRDAIAQKFESTYGQVVDPETQLCVTCGSTEAMMSAALAVIDPGDEVVVFEPFYENYGPDAILSGATPRFVTLHEPDWHFDDAELTAAFNERTRAIIINTPNNPTGKVFTGAELEQIAALCQKWGVVAITDEIYEFMTYEGTVHFPLITIPGMEDRTILINAMSKTYSVTGWRVGWCISSPELTSGIRKVHDFLTVGAAAPLQEAGVVALNLPDAYYRTLAAEYLERRDLMLGILDGAGFKTYKPYGAYYIMTDCSSLGYDDDVTAARSLTETIGVASVPGSSFYKEPELGRTKLRFSFCKKLDTLRAAGERLSRLQK